MIGFNFAPQSGCKPSSSGFRGGPCPCLTAERLCSGTSASTLSLILVGVVVLLLGGVHEVRTKRDALFPPTAFKDRTIGAFLVQPRLVRCVLNPRFRALLQ